MPTECSAKLFEFTPVVGRAVVAGFDGGSITSDAGALLLGATDRALRLIDRFAACFIDRRKRELVEHSVPTLVGQRVFGIALGYVGSVHSEQAPSLGSASAPRALAQIESSRNATSTNASL
jgi:hypothetical protein